MADLFERFADNPLIVPEAVPPSVTGALVECVLNPGAFMYAGEICLLMRVAERMPQREGYVSTLVADPAAPGGARVVEFSREDPRLDYSDPRVFTYGEDAYLTTLSHLRLARSADGRQFSVDKHPLLCGSGELESFGLEDCRVTELDGTYHLTYTMVSPYGVGAGLRTTRDWREFTDYGMILPPHNKDVALFPEKIGGRYHALHRPSGCGIGGSFIWLASSENLHDWGRHCCLIRTRPGMWDSGRVGAGAAPIKTAEGWLEIYHAADHDGRYCLGALLLDAADPGKVLARSREPIMEPLAEYEQKGFYGNCVFTNGHIVDGDRLLLYYGASDTVICGAEASLARILATLK